MMNRNAAEKRGWATWAYAEEFNIAVAGSTAQIRADAGG